jgi:hypothetical protein
MIPIYEQGGGKGIGHNLRSFLARFDQICERHLNEDRAKSFAFIFYDFTDRKSRAVLKNQGVFTQLDRLSGLDLSVFFLHTGTRHAVKTFNDTFLRRLGVSEEATLPCVVFFKLTQDGFSDISVANLDHNDLIHAFKELHDVIDAYIKASSAQPKYGRWIKGAVKFVTVEAMKEAIKYGLGL